MLAAIRRTFLNQSKAASLRPSLFAFNQAPSFTASSSVQRRFFSDDSESKEAGTVKWFDASKGFGFIVKDNGEDLFVHFTAIKGSGYRTLEEGQKVEFRTGSGQKGPCAQDVTIRSA